MSDETRATDRPATFRDVFASREYRFLYGAIVLSWFGDYLARAAVTALVFARTQSVVLSAAAFALSYLPWLVGGPVLSAIAERRSYRSVMVTCDAIRATLMLIVAIPGIPVPLMLLLLFGTALANPPFQAARWALLTQLQTGDRYVVGLAMQQSSSQAAQLAGYVVGAAVAPFFPHLALLFNALTFAVSGLLIRYGIGNRGPLGDLGPRRHLVADAADGFRVVFGNRVLRVIALVVFSSMLFAIVPEGLAAAWAATLAKTQSERGWIQALIMAAQPVGFIVGGLIIGRLVRPETRRRLIRPFVILAPLALVPALANPPAVALAVMALVCGFAVSGMLPPANGMFVQALPAAYRARAYGVMQGGMQVIQGSAVLVTGLLADRFSVPTVVGWWSLAGVLLLTFVVLRWPPPDEVERAIAAARATAEDVTEGGAPPPRGDARGGGRGHQDPVEASA